MVSRITIISALLAATSVSVFADVGVVEDQARFYERPVFIGSSIKASTGAVQDDAKQVPSVFILAYSEDTTLLSVKKIISASSADLVLLDAGYNKNIRPGMVCLVERKGKAIASLHIAESTPDSAVALILPQAFTATIQAGDTARIKTVYFN